MFQKKFAFYMNRSTCNTCSLMHVGQKYMDSLLCRQTFCEFFVVALSSSTTSSLSLSSTTSLLWHRAVLLSQFFTAAAPNLLGGLIGGSLAVSVTPTHWPSIAAFRQRFSDAETAWRMASFWLVGLRAGLSANRPPCCFRVWKERCG